MIRLLCVEDDPLMRTYLATRLELEPDLQVVAVAGNAGEALQLLGREPVDVVLLDYRLEGADGLQLLGALRSASHSEPGPRVLFCTGTPEEDFPTEARARGASGVVRKDRIAAELLPAVRAVAGGYDWFER